MRMFIIFAMFLLETLPNAHAFAPSRIPPQPAIGSFTVSGVLQPFHMTVSDEPWTTREIQLAISGRSATLRRRRYSIGLEHLRLGMGKAKLVERGRIGQQQQLLDPFGLVTWPGSVVAAQALREKSQYVKGKTGLVLGAGVGVEIQALAELGAKHILATDIHPTTLQQLQMGVDENNNIHTSSTKVQTRIFDLMSGDPLPMLPSTDLIVVADVFYNEQLASGVVQRMVEGWKRNPNVKILVTDSQRFVDFLMELTEKLEGTTSASDNPVKPTFDFTEHTLNAFTGSGVCIDDDQTYDVKVRRIWIGSD